MKFSKPYLLVLGCKGKGFFWEQRVTVPIQSPFKGHSLTNWCLTLWPLAHLVKDFPLLYSSICMRKFKVGEIFHNPDPSLVWVWEKNIFYSHLILFYMCFDSLPSWCEGRRRFMTFVSRSGHLTMLKYQNNTEAISTPI